MLKNKFGDQETFISKSGFFFSYKMTQVFKWKGYFSNWMGPFLLETEIFHTQTIVSNWYCQQHEFPLLYFGKKKKTVGIGNIFPSPVGYAFQEACLLLSMPQENKRIEESCLEQPSAFSKSCECLGKASWDWQRVLIKQITMLFFSLCSFKSAHKKMILTFWRLL